jgi:hypothetical protein
VTHLVIFGERPGPNTDPKRPLFEHTTTGAAARLRALLNMSPKEFNETSRYNVVNDQTTSTADPAVRNRVMEIMTRHMQIQGLPKFLFLGRSAQNAGPPLVRGLDYLEIKEDAMVIPHPSGRNRWYNSQANVAECVEALNKFLGRI